MKKIPYKKTNFVLIVFVIILTHFFTAYAQSTSDIKTNGATTGYMYGDPVTIQRTADGKISTVKNQQGGDITALYQLYPDTLTTTPNTPTTPTNTATQPVLAPPLTEAEVTAKLQSDISNNNNFGANLKQAQSTLDGSNMYSDPNAPKYATFEGKTIVPLTYTHANPTDTSTSTLCNASTGLCTYTLMAPISGLFGGSDGKYVIKKDDKSGLCLLLNSWFRIGIALAGLLAVVMIVLGGFQYATTDSLFDKSEGKGKIQNALWGLLLALSTWLVIYTINPDLTSCDINAKAVTLSQMSTAVSGSGALGSDIMSLGMLGASNALSAAGSASSKSDTEIEAEYNKAYAGWTEEDDKALAEDPENAGLLEKWNGIQFQIDSLDKTYANTSTKTTTSGGGSGGSGSSGTANQRILDQISSGGNQCNAAHCFAGAEAEANLAGIKYSSAYQSTNYIVGGKTLNTFGEARLPTPGEQVDYQFYTDGTKSDPFHTVIVKSINSDGSAVVWDWKNGAAEGYRKVNFNLDSPGTKGYIGRIYTPSLK